MPDIEYLKIQWTTLPFSSFYSWHHFTKTWKSRGLQIIDIETAKRCNVQFDKFKVMMRDENTVYPLRALLGKI